ncbi:hypothetical protein TTHERM_000401915 (macronuclear) [Tetrahymena thermophila SB210]|uniref:Uncharacterized protein n=1 Tax=Tetrahymena thermophila (strain SB210) TaxID=312017 RepID=W7X611_TETTS|nr:hypothetical protein TTHERM_000401915 [Tetrahymena thermophila SB210]EWS74785.1 hypothetical protein TTHERM_000401915 [Tetrahymena thermophila SB210]|eukprot:XP_012652678.1 hypothetical protein TTHERM_000401915 [Tetrahymena thermophila SB210]
MCYTGYLSSCNSSFSKRFLDQFQNIITCKSVIIGLQAQCDYTQEVLHLKNEHQNSKIKHMNVLPINCTFMLVHI